MDQHNYIPDVMSSFDCQMISHVSTLRKLNSSYDFIPCGDGEYVCCQKDSIEPADQVYIIH